MEVRLRGQVHRAHPLRRAAAADQLEPCGAAGVRLLLECQSEVDHPRWSQATERRIGEDKGGGGFAALFAPKRKTLMFNGYAEQVASLYQGMDLRKYSDGCP